MKSSVRFSRRRRLIMMLCIVAGTTPVAIAWAGTTQYVTDGDAQSVYCNYDCYYATYFETCCTANRTYNEVWKPDGYFFKLVYSGDTTGHGGTGNPVLDTRNWSDAYAACQNQDQNNPNDDVYPVTCQTDY